MMQALLGEFLVFGLVLVLDKETTKKEQSSISWWSSAQSQNPSSIHYLYLSVRVTGKMQKGGYNLQA